MQAARTSKNMLLTSTAVRAQAPPSPPQAVGCIDDDDPETCTCTQGGDNLCDSSGGSAAYSESFAGDLHHSNRRSNSLRRNIEGRGCPNHDSYPVNLNCASWLNVSASIPAYPFFNGASYADALAAASDLSSQGGDVGLTLNGVAIYTPYAGSYDYDGDGDVDGDDVMSETANAVTAEGDTFDRCGGHPSGNSAGYQYHYHVPPTCLLAQLGQYAGRHSPQVGWLYDGFPVYGPSGPGGVEMKRCGQVGAHATICLDACNGYFSDDGSIDVYKYRYYMSGETTDQSSLRASPLPTSAPANSSFYPFTPLCALGCKPAGATNSNWEGAVASWLPVCDDATAVAGYTFSADLDSSTPSGEGGLQPGVTAKYVAGTNPINNVSSASSDAAASYTAPHMPNVLIFQPDDLYQGYSPNWDAPADPGFGLPQTPTDATYQIDRIAREGATFTRAYTASAMCAPSRVALLTGRHASRGAYAISQTAGSYSGTATRVSVPYGKLAGDDLTHNLAAALRSVSYTTGCFGKFHVAAETELAALGCSFSSTESECDYAVAQAAVRGAGFDVAEAIFISNLNTCGATCSATFSHNTEWVTHEALQFMAGAIGAATPFFAYVNPTVPHGADAKNSLQDTSASTGLGPYDCTASPAGTLGDAWAAPCAASLATAADFSALCSTCQMATRDALWASSAGACSGASDRSTCSGVAWVDASLGSLYASTPPFQVVMPPPITVVCPPSHSTPSQVRPAARDGRARRHAARRAERQRPRQGDDVRVGRAHAPLGALPQRRRGGRPRRKRSRLDDRPRAHRARPCRRPRHLRHRRPLVGAAAQRQRGEPRPRRDLRRDRL